MRVSSLFRGGALLSAVVLGGCYVYTPVRTPDPGAEVRVVIPVRTAAQGARGIQESASVFGRVVSSGETLVIETRNRQPAGFMQDMLLVDTLRMAQADLLSVEQRSFSRGKTALFSVGVAAGAFLAFKGIQSVTSGDDGGEPGGNGNNTQLTGPGNELFRITLPFGGR